MDRKPADRFDPVSPEHWREVADASLRGRPVGDLARRTDDGLLLEPVYFRPREATVEGGSPGAAPFLRGATTLGPDRGWDIRSRVRAADPEAMCHRALAELEGGADSLELVLDGGAVGSAADLNRALEGVYLDLAPVAVDAGPRFEECAAWLREVWHRREHDPATVEGAWNVDPLALAVRGGLGDADEDALGEPLRSVLERGAALARDTAAEWPRLTTFRVDASLVHDAGGSDVQELSYALAAGVLLLRSMERHGLGVERAVDQIVFQLAVDADVFAGIAKIRALRLLWSRVCEAAELPMARGARIQAVTARRMLTVREPLVNALRSTSAMTAAALAGAEVVTVLPWDERLGTDLAAARRLARNTQVILREESHLHRVRDPAGGSWFLEERSRRIAEAAWGGLRAVEGEGGIVESLRSGTFARAVETVAEDRRGRLRRRRSVLVGVSDFARLRDAAVDHALPLPRESGLPAGGVLPFRPLDADFERFRRASDRHLAASGSRPSVWLANLGALAVHNARTTFTRNLLAAGGVEARDGDGVAVPGDAGAEVPVGTTVAVVCSSDEVYAEGAVDAVASLRGAGVDAVYLAGDPGELGSALEEAGMVGFLRLGMDAIEFYEDLYGRLGVPVGAAGEAT